MRLTFVLRQGGPKTFGLEQRRNPALASRTLVGPDVSLVRQIETLLS
jgi:hypothetical protein